MPTPNSLGKNPDAGKDWRQKEHRAAEDEMVGHHHQFNGLELGRTSRRWWNTGRPSVLQYMASQSQTWLGDWITTEGMISLLSIIFILISHWEKNIRAVIYLLVLPILFRIRKTMSLASTFFPWIVVVQLPSHVWLFATPWTIAYQASLSLTISLTQSSCPLSRWCHPATSSSSDALCSFWPQSFPASGTFPMSQLFTSSDYNTGVSASASILSRSTQGWFPWGLTGLISLLSKGLSGVFSSTQFEGIDSSVLCLLHGPALTTLRDNWEDHSLDYTDFCQQSHISAFQHTV